MDIGEGKSKNQGKDKGKGGSFIATHAYTGVRPSAGTLHALTSNHGDNNGNGDGDGDGDGGEGGGGTNGCGEEVSDAPRAKKKAKTRKGGDVHTPSRTPGQPSNGCGNDIDTGNGNDNGDGSDSLAGGSGADKAAGTAGARVDTQKMADKQDICLDPSTSAAQSVTPSSSASSSASYSVTAPLLEEEEGRLSLSELDVEDTSSAFLWMCGFCYALGQTREERYVGECDLCDLCVSSLWDALCVI